jgi:hypothetical protein
MRSMRSIHFLFFYFICYYACNGFFFLKYKNNAEYTRSQNYEFLGQRKEVGVARTWFEGRLTLTKKLT